MRFEILFPLYLGVILLASVAGWYRYASLNTAMKVVCILLPVTFITEALAYVIAVKYRNNMPVYAVYNIIELMLTAVYFNYAIGIFRRKNTGLYIAGISLIAGVIYYSCFQRIDTFSTNFLLFEGLCIMTMSIFSIHSLYLHHDNIRLACNPHFWMATILLFFWSMTLAHWGLYHLLSIKYTELLKDLFLPLWIVNMITYGAIANVFIFYPKLHSTDE